MIRQAQLIREQRSAKKESDMPRKVDSGTRAIVIPLNVLACTRKSDPITTLIPFVK
jgi:hypothetical protein